MGFDKKKFILTDIILLICAFVSFVPWVNIFSILIFVINFFTFKRQIKFSFIFFSIAIFFNILSLLVDPIVEIEAKKATRQGFHEERLIQTQRNLNKVAINIIAYKKKHGRFPNTLRDVQKNSIGDVSYNVKEGSFENPLFYYEIIDSTRFYIAAIGRDGQPKTEDDILPEITQE